jgi:hypothetical protein
VGFLGLGGSNKTAKEGLKLQRKGLDLQREALQESRRANREAERRADEDRMRARDIEQKENERAATELQAGELATNAARSFRNIFAGSLSTTPDAARRDPSDGPIDNPRSYQGLGPGQQRERFTRRQEQKRLSDMKPKAKPKTKKKDDKKPAGGTGPTPGSAAELR